LNKVFYTAVVSVHLCLPVGVRWKIFRGAKTIFSLSASGSWRRKANWRTQNALPFLRHKENSQCYGNSCKQCSL